ncbi:S-layer homology domain-containing protein [Dialister invisus]|uniref:S-layer homology domain-containing protein n=1 Tax=Dialister invisus TaxID=218538 RepID=UPI0035223DE4
MNKIYKVIWSKVKNSYVVVPEIAVSSSKNKGNKAYKSALAAVLTAMLGFGGFVGSEAATVNDGDTLNGSTHITVTKDPATKTITISTTGLATTGDLATLSTQVNTNTGNINNNATHISTNATNISTNAGNISNNTLKINTLTALTNSLGLDATKPGIKYFRANSTGADASAVGSDAVAVGTQARATKDNAMAMGVEAKAEAEDSVSVGHASRNVSNAVNGVAIGHGAINGAVSGMTPDGDSTVVLVGGGKNSVSVGNKANARGNSSIALGDGAVVQNDGGNRIVNNNSMAIGTAAKTVSSNNATAIGHGAFVAKNSHSAIAVGESAQAGKEAATAIGKEAAAKGKNSLAAGTSAVAEGENAVSVGQGTEAKGKNAVAIGNASQTAGSSSVAVGDEAGAAAGRSVSVGIGAGKGMIGDVLGTKGSHVSIGDEAGQNVDGQHDIAIGTKAGGNVSSNYNIAIGVEAGTNIGTAGNPSIGKNVSIGYNANKNATLVSRLQATAVGSDTKAADDALALGFHAQAAGNGSIAAGFNALAEDAASMALGQGAKASGGNIAIGNGSEASAAMISGTGYLTGTAAPSTGVSVGTAAALRRITNVADGAQDQDVVTVAQLKKSIDETVRQVNASITSTTATGVYYDTVTTGQGESITLKNTNNKGTVIHNVAKGTSGTDAVNVNQLNETVDQAKTHYYSVKSTNANNYNNDGAAGEDSMAAGVGAKALEKRSAAIGNNVEAQGEGSIALGTGYEEINGGTPTITQTVAASGYKYNMAIGAGAQSEGNHSIAMGTRAVTTIKNGGTSVDKAVAIGYAAGASDDKAVAIGSEAKSNSRSAAALGDRAHALANDALAIGTTANATGESSGAIGTANTVNGAGTYVIGARNSAPTTPVASNGSNITAVNSGVFGNENTLDGENNRVTGNSNIVKKETATGLTDIMLTGNNNTVSGDTDTTTQDDAGKMSGITITGSKNTVKAKNNTKNLTDVQIVGNNNTVDASSNAQGLSNTQILGSNVNATMGNSVYLGSGSAYVADSASTKGMAVYNSDGTYAYAGGTPAGVVTVGAKGKERRIQNVAAGLVAPQSTDAVNGSQLYTMTRPLRFGGDNSTIGATSAADVNVVKRGSDQAMSILGGADGSKLSDNNIGVVADAANNKFNVKLAKELKDLTSVTTKDAAGNTTVTNGAGTTVTDSAGNKTEVTAGGVTITPKTPGPGKTNVSLTADGLNNGGNQIHNVEKGTADTDAVNVSQLKDQSSGLIQKGFGIQAEDGQKVHKDLGSDVEVVGDGKNITTKVEGGKVKVALKDDINVNSVTTKDAAGNTTVTNGAGTTMTDSAGNKTEVTAGGIAINKHDNLNLDGTVKDPQKTVSLTADGLNNGGNQIHNVAKGTAGTDAVNVDQLKDEIAANATKLVDGKNTTVEGDGTAANPYKVNVKDNINLGEKGANGKDGSIGVNGKDGSAVVINGKDGSIGLNGKDGKDGLTMKSAAGANGVDGTDGNNGTNGMTRIVYEDKNGVTHEVATMGDGLKFAGNTGTVAKKLNETMTIKGTGTKADAEYDSSNIKTMVNDNGEMIVGLDKNLKADSLAINGKDGKDGATIKGGDGKPGVDGTNITRLVIEEKDGKQHDIATLDDGMKYGGDTGAVIKKKLNEQVNVVGGITDTNKLTTEDNLGVVSDGNNNLKVRMAKDLKGLETVTTKTVTADTGNITTVNSDTVNAKTVKTGDTTINDNGLTINNGPSITKNGVDAGDKKITNVAPGDISPTSKDAVNGSQLFQTNQSISRLGDRVNKVGAGAAALAALHPLDFDPDDKWDVAAGYGNYKDAHAVAVGAFYRPNEDTMFSVGGSFGGGENMVNAGVSVKLGQGNHVSTSKVAMAKEIKDLRNEVEQLRSALGQVVQGQALDPMKIKLFPDIPENHWAYEYIATLAGNDIIEGYPDGNFGGDRMMTRYEFGAIVYRAMQRGFEVPARMLKEFEPELERFRVDTIAQNKAGQPTIERVRVIHNR